MIRLYSTLQRAVVDFEPRDPPQVGIYLCGPTVQGHPHIGHGRSAVVFDMIRRYLTWRGFDVTYVRNVTDIDDKIIDKAREAGEEVADYAARMELVFDKVHRRLGAFPPDVEPRATDNISQIHDLIRVLVERGAAYPAGDDVYFSVRTDEDYGRLSRRDVNDMRSGVRIEPGEAKHDPLDFALWKGAKPGEPSWESPWGPGRPGWHIECSAMAHRYLGTDFDIHGGGNDLVFPHHENELAQSETALGEPFARYWLHHGLVNLDGAKMAKSTGNLVDLDAALDAHGGTALRVLFLRAHYRAPIEYSPELVEEAAESLRRVERLLSRTDPGDTAPSPELMEAFAGAMDEDFGTPEALAVVFDAVRDANRILDEGGEAGAMVAAATEMLSVLGIEIERRDELDVEGVAAVAGQFGVTGAGDVAGTVDALLALRHDARSEGDFATSDAVRDRLAEVGVVVEDTPDGARWVRA